LAAVVLVDNTADNKTPQVVAIACFHQLHQMAVVAVEMKHQAVFGMAVHQAVQAAVRQTLLAVRQEILQAHHHHRETRVVMVLLAGAAAAAAV
jgi:purine-nucleoside phosphorylase